MFLFINKSFFRSETRICSYKVSLEICLDHAYSRTCLRKFYRLFRGLGPNRNFITFLIIYSFHHARSQNIPKVVIMAVACLQCNMQ